MQTGRSAIALDERQADMLSGVYQAAVPFFALPEVDRIVATLPLGCGYVPFGQEHSGDPDQPDQVDFFVYNPRIRRLAERVASPAARALLDAMACLFDELEILAEAIAAPIASRIGGHDASARVGGGLRGWSLLELHRARPVAPGVLVNTPHEDGVLLTLAHANAPGLEIETDGVFAPAARPEPGMVVMPGSALTLLTGGAIPPLTHRVRPYPSERTRMSVVFFADLDPDLCTPWRRTAVNAGVDIGAHVTGNSRRFGVAGFARE